MLEISERNSRTPCFESCEIRLTAIWVFELDPTKAAGAEEFAVFEASGGFFELLRKAETVRPMVRPVCLILVPGIEGRECKSNGGASPMGFYRRRRDGDVDEIRTGIVVDPGDDRLAGLEIEVDLRTPGEVRRRGGGVGAEGVRIDADVVVVDVVELEVLDGVELDGEQVVGGVADGGGVEEAEVLAGLGGGEVARRGDREGQAVAAEAGVLRVDGDGEAGREGEDGAGGGVFEPDRGVVEGVADKPAGFVGELEDSVAADGCGAV
ncbi:E3 ubiquitin-protein ligase HECW2 [Striga asiatica]|uniref:E3 ubiquitin-protein ligase HECW2 n=1 Tax=Striga asiatica TaxID=4170 RepID=A0A5A7PZQ8_STRAF|nr:E3 ubiquitin-protein ligase HECW2 [Striga asiatica]